MSTSLVRVGYRPVRIGWCVRDKSLEDFRRVLRFSNTLWGGRFNPIISVADLHLAEQLVDIFHVDALYPASTGVELTRFIEQFPYLPWPTFHKDLFIGRGSGNRGANTFLDIYHPVRRLFEEYVKDREEPKIRASLYELKDKEDPLQYVLLVASGQYPDPEEIGIDYKKFVETYLNSSPIELEPEQPLPPDMYKALTPLAISGVDVEGHVSSSWRDPGIYLGSVGDFDDLVNFWNLRAADIDLKFFDPMHLARLRPLRDEWLRQLDERPRDPNKIRNRIAIWTKHFDASTTVAQLEDVDAAIRERMLWCSVGDGTWNGLNVKVPTMYLGNSVSILATRDDDGDRRSHLSFQLPAKPFFSEPNLHQQHVVVSIQPLTGFEKDEGTTFATPFIPELNEFYGRKVHFSWREARAESAGLGIITKATRDHLTIASLPTQLLISEILSAFGIVAEQSEPGRIAKRLINQMGGIQGCRVFKIPGVRKLIAEYGPLESFTRSGAVQIIGNNDPATGVPRFSDYESLFIEYRESGKLKPGDALEFLLKRNVFRAGLKLRCPLCELMFWIHLDAVRTNIECELCGNEFNITNQLKDRDWAYRRSGLFGRTDHQLGSIPVALTLQQLDTILGPELIYTTGMNLAPQEAAINKCEVDFILVGLKTSWYNEKPQIAIGEAKDDGGEITEQDVSNLSRVADAISRRRLDPYIVFSKTGVFRPEEIERCKKAQEQYRKRVILLSGRELEPYDVYERTVKEFEIDPTAIALENLATATDNIYFAPKRRPRHEPGVEQEIKNRAYEVFEARDREHGHDVDDWLQAEREIAPEKRDD